MNIFFKIGAIIIVPFLGLYDSFPICATDQEESSTLESYFIKEVKCLSKPNHWLGCEVKFSEPQQSLNKILIINSFNFTLTQYYKVDSAGNVLIRDLREASRWKSINQPSLHYNYYLENDIGDYERVKERIFGVFIDKKMPFGSYVMNVKFLDNNDMELTFSIL